MANTSSSIAEASSLVAEARALTRGALAQARGYQVTMQKMDQPQRGPGTISSCSSTAFFEDGHERPSDLSPGAP